MEIYTRRIGESYILKLCGELDACTADSVAEKLDEVVKLSPAQIQIDCKELKYISSWGLGVFISRYQEMKDKQIDFIFFNLSEQILYVFRVLGLEDLMDLRPEKAIIP